MKIERKSDGELVLFITENEFKRAFSSEDNYIKFRKEILDIIGVFHELNTEITNKQ